MIKIIITGAVGTGKTFLAKALANKLGYRFIDVNKVIMENNLSEGFDKKRQSKIIDTKKLNKYLIKEIKNHKLKKSIGVILDSHLSQYLPKQYIDVCIVTKCNLKILEKRLKKRRYSSDKIRENLDAEIFDICLEEAKQKKHKIKIVDTSENVDINRLIKDLKL